MSNIAQHLPQQTKTVKAIYAHHKRVGDSQLARGYLGASIVGHPCERYLWYNFRQCCIPNISGRIYRLFVTGDLAELRFASELGHIGCEVHTLDENGEQFAVSAFGGHFSGHMDGCALGIPEAPKTWHVIEMKTHNAKSFRELQKNQGGIIAVKFQHYAQMQVYMHLSGMKRALYLAVNKDTDELYSERVQYDATESKALISRAERVITSTSPPDRISSRRDFYQCGWCDAKSICHGTESSEPALPVQSLSCKHCCHATPITREPLDGKPWWHCEKQNAPISCDEICKEHLILPGLLEVFVESMVYDGHGAIEFTNKDGTGTWKHGKGGFSSEELTKLPAMLLTNKMVKDVKDVFKGSRITDHHMTILARYQAVKTSWGGPASELVKTWGVFFGEDLLSLVPIARDDESTYKAVEFAGGRVAILWIADETAEIREEVK